MPAGLNHVPEKLCLANLLHFLLLSIAEFFPGISGIVMA